MDLQKTLFPGDHVEFDVVPSDRDPDTFVAKQVRSESRPCTPSLERQASHMHAADLLCVFHRHRKGMHIIAMRLR